MPGEFVTIHIIIKGKIQGVGFRAFAKHLADKLQIKGSARNLSNGSVEIYAQGSKENLKNFSIELKEGNGLAKIENFSIDEYASNPKEYHRFEIIF